MVILLYFVYFTVKSILSMCNNNNSLIHSPYNLLIVVYMWSFTITYPLIIINYVIFILSILLLLKINTPTNYYVYYLFVCLFIHSFILFFQAFVSASTYIRLVSDAFILKHASGYHSYWGRLDTWISTHAHRHNPKHTHTHSHTHARTYKQTHLAATVSWPQLPQTHRQGSLHARKNAVHLLSQQRWENQQILPDIIISFLLMFHVVGDLLAVCNISDNCC